MAMANRLVIIGAGQAGFAMAAKLRARGDPRAITIVGAEDVLPYQRPPLSKEYLLGKLPFNRLMFRSAQWYVDNSIETRLSTRAERIDRARRQVVLDDGSVLDYGTLALTTGSTPRRLPVVIGGELEGVYVARDKRDADRLAAEMWTGRRLLVIGGGYIGLESAAVARQLGLEVTVIETADRILQRVAAPETSALIRLLHERHDVVIREKTGLTRLIGVNGRVAGAELSCGTVIDIDLVIVGIGVSPNDRLAREAELEVANGIVVDTFARTSDPSIFAAGDCTVLPWQGSRARLESVQNAVDQAEAAAAVIAGGDIPYEPKPWFWSDQYDVKLQIAGLNLGYDEALLRSGPRDGAHSVWYFRGSRFIAVDAINDAKAYMVGKKMLEVGLTPDRAVLADGSVDLKLLLN
jgi:3-phenylpropionate/trans-cinnamate dioxygenase ferredoxin reductase subunit